MYGICIRTRCPVPDVRPAGKIRGEAHLDFIMGDVNEAAEKRRRQTCSSPVSFRLVHGGPSPWTVSRRNAVLARLEVMAIPDMEAATRLPCVRRFARGAPAAAALRARRGRGAAGRDGGRAGGRACRETRRGAAMAGDLEELPDRAGWGAGPESASQDGRRPSLWVYLSPSPISLVAGPILTKEEGRKGWVCRKREEARCVTVTAPVPAPGNPYARFRQSVVQSGQNGIPVQQEGLFQVRQLCVCPPLPLHSTRRNP